MGSGGSKHKPGSRSSNQPPDRPSPPGKPFLIPGSQYDDPDVITIGWDPPIILGGSRLIGFVVEHKRTGSPYWVKATPLLVRHNQLSLSGLEPGMRYQFRVTAENTYGRSEPSPLSDPFAISFSRSGVAIAPLFATALSDAIAIENEKVEFTVKAAGTPTPKISWFKDGFEVFSNRRQRVVTDGDISTLIIHQAALSDEGEIKCTATNKAGHAVTKGKLTLEAPPSIRLQRQYEDGLLFELGEVIRLKVAVSGRPQPEIVWYHNGDKLVSDGRVEMAITEKHALVKIADATRLDRGEYQVKANNHVGDDSASFLVTITDRPLPPANVEVVMTLGRCVTLGWSIPKDDGGCMIGNYIVEYYRIGWNMWLKAATCRQLQTTIGDLIEGSEYKFRVKAENPYGMSDPSEESDIVFIPDPKRGLLEPPPKGAATTSTDEPSQWMENRNQDVNRRKKNRSPSKEEGEWTEDESLPSQVLLAHQVLKKVKLAPQRTWSEDSQGSPPREMIPTRKPPPIPPKRKHRPIHSKSASPPHVVKRERKLPPHLQKEFDRVYAQMGDRAPSPETRATSRRIKTIQKLEEGEGEEEEEYDDDTSRSQRASRHSADPEAKGKTRKPSRSPMKRETRTPSRTREVTLVTTASPQTTRPSTPMDEETERRLVETIKKEEVLKKKEEELMKKMEELEKREKEMKIEAARMEKEQSDRAQLLKTVTESNRNEKKEEAKKHFVEWGRELSHEIHSSSEMILVLLPNNDGQDGNDDQRIIKDELRINSVAPPMSLSAPVLGGYEMPPPSLRSAVSSSEIMYELSLARLNKEADEAEAENNLRRRYGIERKRSFEKKSTPSRNDVPLNDGSSASLDRLHGNDDLSTDEIRKKDDAQLFSDDYAERFKILERNFENYNQKFEIDELKTDVESDFDRSFDYFDDERPIVEEETYHPRMTKGIFTPIAVQLPVREFPEMVPTHSTLGPPPLITIDEEDDFDVSKKTEITTEITERKSTPSPTNFLPKPILKIRDRSSERDKIETSDSESSIKRVRIEEPRDKERFDLYEVRENDIGLHAGEVARNRRKQSSKTTAQVQNDVAVNIYSDIIREFSQMKKPPVKKLYLSYEELKEAAEKAENSTINDDLIEIEAEQNRVVESQLVSSDDDDKHIELVSTTSSLPRPKKLYVEYLLDLFLFLVAVWLYIFKDPRLTLPILILMVYRQVNETLRAKFSSLRRFVKKPD